SFEDLTRLVTNSFSVQDNDKLRLKLKHYLNNFAVSGNTLAIQVSFDDGEWTNLWEEELTSDIGPMDMELYIDIPTGTAEMRLGWEFNGDSYDINNYNFDDVVVEPVKENDLAAISVAGNPTPTAGETSTYTVTIQNAGTVSQSTYSVRLMREGGIELASAPGVPIDFAQTKDFAFDWTPTDDDEGPVVIYGEVELAGDEVLGNNQTDNLTLDVQPGGTFVATIGTGTELPSVRIPFDFFWKNSFVQTLYFPSEIGLGGGALTAVSYTNQFTSDLQAMSIKVWVGETDVTDLSDGWVDPTTLTLVYDGTMDFPSGENTIYIPFDMPYVYTGGNLVIYTNRVWEDDYHSSSDKFYGTEDAGSTRTYRLSRDGTEGLDPMNPGSGSTSDWHPNTALFFSTDGLGALEGTVTDGTNPIEEVEVSVLGTMAKATTDANGQYAFPYLLPETYSVHFEKFGYNTHTEEDVVITEDGTTTVNATLAELPNFTVTGIAKGNDDVLFEGAIVNLMGYSNQVDTTDAAGVFTFENIYEGTYELDIAFDGYENYSDTAVAINSEAATAGVVDLGTLTLNEIIITPSGLSVDVLNQAEGKALFTWSDGEVEFRYDDGTADGQLGFQNGTVDNVLGAVHRHNAQLNSVSWYLTSEGGPHATVKVWILGLTEAGIPDASNVLFSQDGIENTDMEWNTFELPETVQAPNGFFIGVGSAGFLGLATDTGIDTEWPFQPNSNYGGNIASGEFFSFESQDFTVNALIRATGTDLGELRFDPEAVHYPMVSDLVYTKNETPVRTYNPSSTPSTKAFSGYDIYLNDMGTPEATAIQEAQHLFTGLPVGNHTAGVQAVYTTDSSEIITIDFEIKQVYTVTLTVVNAENDSPVEGATFILEEDEQTTGETGVVTYSLIDGTYAYTVTKEGYTDAAGEIVVDGADVTQSITLHPAHTVTLTVVEEDTTPIEGATVIFNEGEGLTTDAAGKVVIGDLVNGTYSYTVSKFDYTEVTGEIAVAGGDVEETVTLVDAILTPENLDVVVDGTNATFTYEVSGEGGGGGGEGFTESFEEDFPPAGWTLDNTNATTTWVQAETVTFTSGDIVPIDGAYQAFLMWEYSGQDEWLITPSFTVPTGANLTFWSYTGAFGSTNGDHYYAKISTDDGTTWTALWDAVESAGSDYEEVTIDLTAYQGQDVMLAWQGVDGDGQGLWFSWFIDYITVGNAKEAVSFDGELKFASNVSSSSSVVSDRPFSRDGSVVAVSNKSTKAFVGHTIYLDDMETPYDEGVAGYSYDFTGLTVGTHTAGVQRVYTTGASDVVSIDFKVGHTVTFTVKDDEANTIEGITISINDVELTTDAEGVATIELLDGTYDYTASHDYAYYQATGTVVVDGADWDEPVTMIPTGIDSELFSNLKVYPNPFSNKISITHADRVNRVIITNVVGQRVMDITLNGNKEIGTSELGSGIYLITLEGLNGERIVRKMIKR
ncbi:MAG: carboxypeptidase regulatory-like domain-containing protein, partial [Bacteroidales bacterium]|nr:carboxypeptidase regulatory-like domain-containing protein [Bacteroidales bacterium]